MDTFLRLIEPIANRYALRLQNATSVDGAVGNITVWALQETNPSPISPFMLEDDTEGAWNIFSRAVQATFGEDVVTAPSAMTGNTGKYRDLW